MNQFKWSRQTNFRFYIQNRNFVVFLLWLSKQLNLPKELWIEHIIHHVMGECRLPVIQFYNIFSDYSNAYIQDTLKKIIRYDLQHIKITRGFEGDPNLKYAYCITFTGDDTWKLIYNCSREYKIALSTGYQKVNIGEYSDQSPFVFMH
jgi:hypothetical protein